MKMRFYEKLWFKSIIEIVIPTIISVIGVILSSEELPLGVKSILPKVSIVLLVIFIVLTVLISQKDDKVKNKMKDEMEKLEKDLAECQTYITAQMELIDDLKNKLKTDNNIILTYQRLFEGWAENIYRLTGDVKRSEYTNISWDKVSYYETICEKCNDMIRRYCGTTNKSDMSDVYVSYVELKIDEKDKEYVQVIIDTHPQPQKSRYYRQDQELWSSKYHYADLIRDKYKDNEILKDNQAIGRRFNLIDSNTDLSKYSQYIAIPIHCMNNKILGIFQVVAEYNYIIENEEDALGKFAKEKVVPYTDLILLVDKMHKLVNIIAEKSIGGKNFAK
ncbi:MAG TPA: hypothetical protein DEB74_02265 [Lachnospiraceae bacterium]|nr:hypothetical protein [Lachnospiraceae bacterium]